LIKLKKSLGQNLLIDARVANRIIDAVAPHPGDVVIEIGPGAGALTHSLVDRSGSVVAIEIDKRLVEQLRASIDGGNLTIVEADALELDWRELVHNAIERFAVDSGRDAPSRVRVVANLPYYISTPIIERLLRVQQCLLDAMMMLQREVADRITSGPGSKEYGYLSVLVGYYCVAAKLFDVPPSAFKPAPKVWSAVVRLTVRDRPAVEVADQAGFFALVRACFAQRRKTLANNLKAAAGALAFKDSLGSALERARIDPRRRAETLSIEEFGALYRFLF